MADLDWHQLRMELIRAGQGSSPAMGPLTGQPVGSKPNGAQPGADTDSTDKLLKHIALALSCETDLPS